ncbi:MAG: HAD-IA family hydrolase [Verrucomicrobiales bacterium]|nr:HAD-IA family hydrolase [Verrucomicrobiales bacterium]
MILDIPEGNFEGYIFDCDGTLVDSMPLHYKAWTASFRHHDAPWNWTEDEFYAGAGIPDRVIVGNLNQQHNSDICPDSVHEYKLQWYMERMNELTPVEAVADQVRKCLDSGMPISIGTGSDLALVEPSLKYTGLWDYFDIIITPAEVERGKPAPDMFLLAAERMGVPPQRCLVFEDGQAGIDAATAAGMHSVFVDSRNG